MGHQRAQEGLPLFITEGISSLINAKQNLISVIFRVLKGNLFEAKKVLRFFLGNLHQKISKWGGKENKE